MKDLIITTEFCALCRRPFPTQILEGFDAWQSFARAVFCIDLNRDESIDLTSGFHLPDSDDDLDVPLTRHLQTVTISRGQRSSQTGVDRTAFCFHDWCYLSLNRKLPLCNKSIIFKLARTLTPDPTVWEEVCERQCDLDSISMVQMLAGYTSSFLGSLPFEMRFDIWQYTGLQSKYGAFLVSNETSRLARNLRHPLCYSIALKRGSRISAEMISVFGIEYIQVLNINNDSKGNIVGDTTEVTYVSSLSGICAIQLHGTGWESDWIGKIPATNCVWYGRMRGEIPTLICSYNDLNCATISLTDPSPQQVVWDKPDFPSTLEAPDAILFDFNRDIMQSTIRNPKRRFFRYLSLYNGDEYAKGLSVHMSRNGIVGLGAHFIRTSQFSGHQNGCELYFPLHDGEQIAYAWLRIRNSLSPAFAEPALVIQTTSERIHTFGPYIQPHLASDNHFRWLLLGQKGCITGLYYENFNSGKTIRRLGVIGDGTATRVAPLPPQYHDCDFPFPPIGSPSVDLFLSLAVLSDLEEVNVCYVDKRCTGMQIRYHNNHTVVLGQWHSSRHSRGTCIYYGNGAPITNIYFRMSKSSRIVTSINLSPDIAETSDSESQVFSIGEHIAWWFSERHDRILSWTGHLSHIPEMSIMKQSL